MSFMPAPLAVEATRTLARSALPDAPVEPDDVRTPSRTIAFLRTLFRPATRPARRRPYRRGSPSTAC